METTNIYVLIDPETQQVRYVGKANDVSQRYKAHLNRARKHQTHKLNWINSLKKKGLKPILEVIDIVPVEEWIFWEIYWIAQMRVWGFDLVNYTKGGDGCTFANQTSFKKGDKPWNTGTASTGICLICSNKFNLTPAMIRQGRKTCSHACSSILKSQQKNIGHFPEKHIPWNKGNSGYRLTGNKKARSVLQFKLTGEFVKEFTCMDDAAKEMNCIKENIRRVCVGKSKTAKNFKWKYKNEL